MLLTGNLVSAVTTYVFSERLTISTRGSFHPIEDTDNNPLLDSDEAPTSRLPYSPKKR
jgi:hypothetical protein